MHPSKSESSLSIQDGVDLKSRLHERLYPAANAKRKAKLGKSRKLATIRKPRTLNISKSSSVLIKTLDQESKVAVEVQDTIPMKKAKHTTFTESLELDKQYMDEFLSGNFLYLAPKKGSERTAYDLEVVEHWETDAKDYYTMSKEGITHFVGNDSEFTSLAQWEREYHLFNVVRRIPFFEKYRKWKSFRVWRKNVSYFKIGEHKKVLKDQLFILSDGLRGALVKIKDLCWKAEKLGLFHVDQEETYTLESFCEAQAVKRLQCMQWLEGFSADVLGLVRSACDVVLDRFLNENKILAEHKMSFMERAALRTECRRLTKFIRAADFMVYDTLFGLALESAAGIVKLFDSESVGRRIVRVKEDKNEIKTKKELMESPLFQVNVDVNSQGMLEVFPSLQQFKERLDVVLSDSMSIVGSIPRLLSLEDLTPYTQAALEDEAERNDENLAEIVEQDESYQNTTSEFFVRLSSAFSEVDEHCTVFEPFLATFDQNNQGTLHGDLVEKYKDADLEVFEEAIEKFKGQSGEFEGIPCSADIGVVRVLSNDLKMRLLPSPENCLFALRELLPKLIRSSADSLLDEINHRTQTLTATPPDVEEFVAKISFLHDTAAQMPRIKSTLQHVVALGDIMKNQQWVVPDDQKALLMMIQEGSTRLEQAVQLMESNLEEDTKKYAKSVSDAIPLLKKRVLGVREQLDHPMIAAAESDVKTVIEFINSQADLFSQLKDQSKKFQHYQGMLQQPVMEFEAMDEVQLDLHLKQQLWSGIRDWDNLTDEWNGMPFNDIDAAEIDKQVKIYTKNVVRCGRGLPSNMAVPKLKNAVENFKQLLPVVLDLRNPSLKERHWEEIEQIIHHEFDSEKTYTLGDLLDLNVMEFQPEIATVATKAVQEAALEELFETKVLKIWNGLEFIVNPFKESRDVFILGSVEEIIVALDDSLVTLNTILGSRFCASVRKEVELWQRKLVLLSETLDEWLQCQKQWMYLETIFSAADIQRQLPEESKKFFGVDKQWKEIMTRTQLKPLAVEAGTHKGMKESFIRANETLDSIQKSLEDYLETKRVAFPRFYFLSNDELLEILAQTRNVQAVQPHLRKCFDAINKLDFGKDPKSVDIHGMISGEGERIPLGPHLKARGNVEAWLMAVQNNMISTLRQLIKAGVMDYNNRPRKEWVLAHAGQVVATVAQIMWSRNSEMALRSEEPDSMENWFKTNLAQLSDLTALVRSDLSKLERKVIVALVTTDVHARDIIEQLMKDGVNTTDNFTWQQQLRYYWDVDSDNCLVKQSNSMIPFGYEYQGCTSRLVITPLTDRCWMTITGAVHIKLGAAPAGPAGTGKTESSKDLAKALGIQCIVFNCSDQIDYKMLGKLFSGLSQCGCWCCLDEFNRIDIEVLSVVAQQLLVLRQGVIQGLQSMEFEGRTIRLRPHCVIVTMNPGYAGRTELPDNLKVLFRPVSMMVPDYALIAEIILFAVGFDNAKALSGKMTKLYKLSSEQLSQQRHYDYGLRAVKSVLVMAGSLKRENPHLTEDAVLIRAMRDSNVPKFLSDDLPLFYAIVGDLFPGVEVPYNDYGDLQVELERQLEIKKLQKEPKFITKIIQLYETFNVRFGVVVVGPTGAGKSTCCNVLADAMTKLRENGSEDEKFQLVRKTILNPKSITMGELYGEFNPLTQEWTDGLASTYMRGDAADETEDRKWTVFDGPIDALWIENMNTVLDDNQTLCLANGERIKLKSSMRMLFEVEDLEVASPATVSRLGVVYVSPTDLGWEPPVRTWITTRLSDQGVPIELVDHINDVIFSAFQKGLNFQRIYCKEPIETVDIQLAMSFCNLFETLLLTFAPDFKRGFSDLSPLITHLLAFCFVWSLGGSISDENYDAFDSFVRSDIPEFNGVNFGTETVFDVFLDKESERFKKWGEIVPAFHYNSAMEYFNMVVPTIDTVRFAFLLSEHLKRENSVYMTGVTGTGKTVIVQDLLNRLSVPAEEGGMNVLPIVLNFSAQTESKGTQTTIENKLEKKRKNLLGGPSNKKVVIFVDDVNMPQVEEYGAQPPIELLRQFMDYRGFFDREKLFWKDIQDTTMLAGSAPPGGGRNKLTKRFTRHFHMLCVPPAAPEILTHIFGAIVGGFLQTFNSRDIETLGKPMVTATIEVYDTVCKAMRPTPSKSHYTFNLRDVSKVVQGVLMIRPKQTKSKETLIRLWIHESMRVFHDRLISFEDKSWFTQLMNDLASRHFHVSYDYEQVFVEKSIMFCDFLRPRMEDGPGIYEEATDFNKITRLLNDALDDYNLTNPTQMHLVFFKDAAEHVLRICRILSQPRGNAMLVGVGGSGKQSLTKMACAIEDIECRSIELTRGYGLIDFREDIKSYMDIAGSQGKQIAFLFTDTQIINDRFLEDINNLLNTGEIPGLFENDEVNKIVETLRPVVAQAGIPETRDNIIQFFVARVRANLHVILAMSPVGDALRIYCRQFPSLINCCTIDWYMPWPKDALRSVAERFVTEEIIHDEALVTAGCDIAKIREGLVDACSMVHKSVNEKFGERFFNELQRKVYTTPKSYLDLINLYLGMLEEKRAELQGLKQRLATGVSKLEETNEMVAGLKAELTKLQPVLDEKAKETEILLEQVAKDQADADVMKDKVGKEKAVVEVQASEVAVIQADAQADLDKAMPAFEAAVNALKSLSKADITEVKGFVKPPPAVQIVMEGVCILLRQKPDWETAKRVLSDINFMNDLTSYDKENIPPSILKKLAKYIEKPEMQVENVKKVSSAATSLCMWVHAMDVYAKVAKTVEPKKKKLAELNAELDTANSSLKAKEDELQAVLDKVATLQRQCDDTVAEKERLADEAQLTKDRLQRAEMLTVGLAEEQVRWKASVEEYILQIRNLVGDVFLSAACISYYGAFTGTYREEMVSMWFDHCKSSGIPTSDNFSLVATMGVPVQIREWQINGLPTDSVSTDNAILVTRGKRWPLMVDPQEQAKKWIRNTEAKNHLQVTRLTSATMLRTLENCIRIGQPLLVEDIGEQLDPALEPVLAKAVFKQQGRLLIHLGDSDIDYDPNFRFYLSTKLPNPHYLPEVCIKVTIINFTVTRPGLEDQLLGDVVRKEKPEVEERKNRLVVSMAADKKQLKDIEDKILRLLSESKGNILDDEVLIKTLGDSKVISGVISQRLKESEKTEIEINETRNQYTSVAARGAIIYFVIADLGNVDPMYQYSLSYFARLFNICIDESEKSDELEERLTNLKKYMTETIFKNICRGLFESHKLLFSFLICVQIMLDSGSISPIAWSLLLRGAGLLVNPCRNPLDDIVGANGWNLLHAAEESLDSFKGISASVSEDPMAWREWVMCGNPHRTPMPMGWDERISMFERLLALRCLKEEKVLFMATDFVRTNMGSIFTESPPVSMQEVYNDTDCTTPTIFILSTGADPTNFLLSFAKQKGVVDRLRVISLGQGQGIRAQHLIVEACKTGDWVLLQNCHLAKSWMPTLEKIVYELSANDGTIITQKPHSDFRLFVTSMPCTYFPVPVLQNGVKLTNEPPKGIRANLMRSVANMDSWVDYEGVSKATEWKKLSMGLCFFHAVIQERRKFGPLGWNIKYEFNDSDLETSVQVLQMFLEEQDRIPWDALTYVTGHINYGGRVTDDWDRRCLMSILARSYTPDILRDSYTFSSSGIYRAPPPGSLDVLKKYLSDLPLNDDPEIFGMHENANMSFQLQETNALLQTCLSIQPRSQSTGDGQTPDQIVSQLADEIHKALPQTLDRSEAGPNTFIMKGEHMDSLATVLSQEMARFNKLLQEMSTSLVELQKAIKGEVLMSETLDKMYTKLLNNQVPENWEAVAYPSLKPLASWVKDLHQRIAFMRNWLQNGQPRVFWLSGFFFPQGFMTGALQNHSRKYALPIDTLNFSFDIFEEEDPDELSEDKTPEDGVLINGLFMDGARWDAENQLIEDPFPGELYSQMPIIHFIPTENYEPASDEYSCPIYKTSVRAGTLSTTGMSTNFVVAVELPTDKSPDYWVLKGVAFLCALND
eukprot:TRINITY_DN2137_c0_g5_i1.p1 TRINITY_DN2137_c0_g5~~TRINITY_DN2137_c0_g5_i1.p1  ORF type:complete len:3984 (-),score=1416.37 TRINITY_DN2137_c0_g5_i1:203-12154(-)